MAVTTAASIIITRVAKVATTAAAEVVVVRSIDLYSEAAIINRNIITIVVFISKLDYIVTAFHIPCLTSWGFSTSVVVIEAVKVGKHYRLIADHIRITTASWVIMGTVVDQIVAREQVSSCFTVEAASCFVGFRLVMGQIY